MPDIQPQSGTYDIPDEAKKVGNQIRDLSLIVYIIQCAIVEGPLLQGAIRKRSSKRWRERPSS